MPGATAARVPLPAPVPPPTAPNFQGSLPPGAAFPTPGSPEPPATAPEPVAPSAPLAEPEATVRVLPEYSLEESPGDRTRVDFEMEARARAMNLLDPPSAATPSGTELPVEPAAPTAALAGPSPSIPDLRSALGAPVRFAGRAVPLWGLVLPLVVGTAFFTGIVVAALSSSGTASDTPSAEVAVAESEAAAPPAGASAGASTAPAMAAPSAAEKPPSLDVEPGSLSAAEVLDIAERRAGAELRAAQELSRALEREPGIANDARTLADMRRMLGERETARTVLSAIAALPGPYSADLLYDAWTALGLRGETSELARALLYSKDVQSKASPALRVALELRDAKTCEENRALLSRAIEHADRRSLQALTKLQRTTGCGPKKRDDCHPCLRENDELERAVKAARARREPKTFVKR